MKLLTSLLTIAASTAALSSTVHAESGADGNAVAGYDLKNRSGFRSDADARIPFWPIGWQRPKVKTGVETSVPVVEAPAIQLQANHFTVSSILLGHPALATINGRSFEEGEMLPVIYGEQRLKVIVRSIRDGGVWLAYEGQLTFVPMRRPELGNRPAQQKAEAVEFAIRIAPTQK